MADGKKAHDWSVAAGFMSLFANANRDTKKQPRPFEPKDFDPYHLNGKGTRSFLPKSRGGMKVRSIDDLKVFLPPDRS